MIAINMNCPSHQKISQLVHGRIQDVEFDGLCEHVVACEACSKLARQIESRFCDSVSHVATNETRAIHSHDTDFLSDASGEVYEGKFGEYTVVRALGSGGMGDVFLVKLSQPERLFAAKALRKKFANDEEFRGRFEREIENVVDLEAHPNIVRITNWSMKPSPYYVMEYNDGGSLKEVVEPGPISMGNAVEVIRQAARGIGHAHAGDVIHRDIKPSNILIDQKGNIRVADFGLSKSLNKELSNLSDLHTFLGTPDYCSPEQVSAHQKVGPASDIYALGCTFFELLTGHPPFSDRMEPNEKLKAHVGLPFPKLDGLPRPLPRLLERMTDKTPAARPSASEVETVLSGLNMPHNLSDLLKPSRESDILEIKTSQPVRVRLQPDRRRFSRKWILVATALLLFAMAGGAMLLDTTISKKFANGTLIANIPTGSDYQILIDGDKVDETVWNFESRDGKDQISIRIKPGEHKFELVRNGLTTYTNSFSISKDKQTELNVEFRLPVASRESEASKEFNEWLAEVGGSASGGDVFLNDLDLRNIGSFKKLALNKKLVHLDLRGSQLPSDGLPDLPPKLETIKLGSQFLGPKHFQDIGSIRLNSLQILKAKIEGGLAHLKTAKGLEELLLNRSEFDPKEIANIAELVDLKCLSFEVYPQAEEADFLCLESLSKLTSLNLNNTKASDQVLKKVVGRCKQLETLDFAGNDISTEGLKELSNLTRLKKVSLNFCTGVTDEGLMHLSQNKGLESLRIYGIGIGPGKLGFLESVPSIQQLDLGDNAIDSMSLECLGKLPKLTWLGLETTKLTGITKNDVLKALPNCEVTD